MRGNSAAWLVSPAPLRIDCRGEDNGCHAVVLTADGPAGVLRGLAALRQSITNVPRAMELVKLNVLHLHLSDNDGFRVESRLYPKLHEKSPPEFYSQTEIHELVSYAADRGVCIVPEIDDEASDPTSSSSQAGSTIPFPRVGLHVNLHINAILSRVLSPPPASRAREAGRVKGTVFQEAARRANTAWEPNR